MYAAEPFICSLAYQNHESDMLLIIACRSASKFKVKKAAGPQERSVIWGEPSSIKNAKTISAVLLT
jgi:hypothetical protein